MVHPCALAVAVPKYCSLQQEIPFNILILQPDLQSALHQSKDVSLYTLFLYFSPPLFSVNSTQTKSPDQRNLAFVVEIRREILDFVNRVLGSNPPFRSLLHYLGDLNSWTSGTMTFNPHNRWL